MTRKLYGVVSAVAFIFVTEQTALAQFSCPTVHDIQIQQALDTAAANGGGVVQLNAGTYETCETLILGPNVHLRGAGRGATIIRGSTETVGKFVEGAYIGASIGGAGVWNVTVSDLTVDHRTHARNANGISFVPTGVQYDGTVPGNVLIERVEVLGAPAGYHNYLIWNLKGHHVKIRDNWLDGGYPIPIPEPVPQEGIETYGGHDVLITGNSVKGVAGSCINAGSAGISGSTTVGVTISNNYVYGCNVGVNLGTSSENGGHHNYESHIVNNVIVYAYSAGITIPNAPGTTQRNLHISGNSIRMVGPGPFAAGIYVGAWHDADVGEVTISRNHVFTVTGIHGHGIRLAYASNVRLLDNTVTATSGEGIWVYFANDVEVSRNRVQRAGVYAVYIGPVAHRSIVTDNLIADWAILSPAMVLEGLSYAAIHRNLFSRTDASRPASIVVNSSCGVELSGNQALYAGTATNGATVPCR